MNGFVHVFPGDWLIYFQKVLSVKGKDGVLAALVSARRAYPDEEYKIAPAFELCGYHAALKGTWK